MLIAGVRGPRGQIRHPTGWTPRIIVRRHDGTPEEPKTRKPQNRRPALAGYHIPNALHLVLALELRVVRSEERPNLIRQVEQLDPLLLVERHRKPSEPIDG